MTKLQAYKTLGISRSASIRKVEQRYHEKQKSLRLQLMPGNSLVDRRKAQTKLIKLTTAWQVLQKSPSNTPNKRKTTQRKPATVIPYQKPQTLAEAWELIVSIFPFSEQTIAIMLGMLFLLVVIGLLSNL